MADSVEVKILDALTKCLSALAIEPALPIAWPNVNFTPPKDRRYLRVQFVPNVVERRFIGSNEPHRYMGLYQVSVHWPQGAGEYAPRRVAAAIVSHFPTDLRLVEDDVEVRIVSRPMAADMLVEKAGVQVPVTIEYECWA